MDFYDFNIVEQQSFKIIPDASLLKVQMSIKSGGYNDPAKGFTDGYATKSLASGAIYLACEFTVLDGEYAGYKIWQLIGLYSDKNDNIWGNMGRYLIRSIINSAKGLKNNDDSDSAQTLRKISSFSQLNSMEFIAKIGIKKDSFGNQKNFIKKAIGPEHQDYERLMVSVAKPL